MTHLRTIASRDSKVSLSPATGSRYINKQFCHLVQMHALENSPRLQTFFQTSSSSWKRHFLDHLLLKATSLYEPKQVHKMLAKDRITNFNTHRQLGPLHQGKPIRCCYYKQNFPFLTYSYCCWYKHVLVWLNNINKTFWQVFVIKNEQQRPTHAVWKRLPCPHQQLKL